MPPLTLNFVDHMLRKKDRLNRKSNKQDEAGFTDDGFALGCAFLLRVLGLYEDFDSLHWWETVEIWLQSKDKKLQQSKKNMGKGGGNDGLEDEEEEWNISYKRNMALSKEWKLLFFGFQASRIFFRVVEDKEDEKEGKKEEENAETKGKNADNDGDKKEEENNETKGNDQAAPPPKETAPNAENQNANPYPTPTSPNDADVDDWAGSSSMQQNNGFGQAPVP